MKQAFFTFSFILVAFLVQAQVKAWQVSWTAFGNYYQGLLWQPVNSNTYMMRVKYYNGGYNVIEENFIIRSYGESLILEGYSPKYISYQNPYARYNADNLVYSSGKFYAIDSVDDIFDFNKWHYLNIDKQLYNIDDFYRLIINDFTR